MENRKYSNKNVNGATIQGAEVVKTYEATIHRFRLKEVGTISYLFDTELNLTYIWLHVDAIEENDDVMILRISLNGFASQKAVKHYVKSYLLENNIRTNNTIVDNDTDKWLETVIEYVNYQGNTIVVFSDKWYDINIITTQVRNKNGLARFGLAETWVYGEFEDDKLIEILGYVDYNLKENNQEYPSQILAL